MDICACFSSIPSDLLENKACAFLILEDHSPSCYTASGNFPIPWIIDSGASHHMTSDPSNFTYSPTSCSSFPSSIQIADGSYVEVNRAGSICTPSLSVPGVLHVPDLSLNLLSVSRLADLGYEVVFSTSGCRIQDQRSKRIVGTGRRDGGIYVLVDLKIPSSINFSNDLEAMMKVYLHNDKTKHRTVLRKGGSSSELRVLACFHDPMNIPTLINLIESSRGTGKKHGLCVYAMHLMELSGRASAILIHELRKYMSPFRIIREQYSNARNIVVAFEEFQHLSQVSIRPMTAISSISTLYDDVCLTAKKKKVAMIILPFHKHESIGGQLETTRADFKIVNRRVLENAPCSVGILVDRGLGGRSHVSASRVQYFVTVLFFGGRDDREALAYGARMAEHPGINLVVVRFMVDPKVVEEISGLVFEKKKSIAESIWTDEGILAEFKKKISKNRSIKYEERTVGSARETEEAIRDYRRCDLFMVGRVPEGQFVGGLNHRPDSPELGPVGSFLISSHSHTLASILALQQYRPEHSMAFLKEEEE